MRREKDHDVETPTGISRRGLFQTAGLSGLAAASMAATPVLSSAEAMLDAVVDTFIPGDTSIPGVGPGGVEGGMRCLLPTIMGEENVDLLVNVMFSLYPDFPTKSYEERAAIMIGLNDNPMTAELFVGLYQATAFAFYSEILGVGPSPCGDPAFPGSFPLIGFPYFTWGASEDEYSCSNAPDVVDDDDYDDDDYDD